MKKIYIALLSISLVFTSCDNWIDPDVNINPNAAIDVGLNQILAGTQVGYTYVQGGDIGRYNSLFTQHHAGVERQHAGIDTYGFTEADVNNSYATIYTDVMQDLDVLLTKASEDPISSNYRGVGKAMMAMSIMQITDLYNDTPFTDAFQLSSDFNPAYDSQQDIYDDIMTLLDEAMADIQAPAGTTPVGSEDLFYGGDMNAWLAFARSLKARAHLHLGETGGSHYQDALDLIDAGAITSPAGNAGIAFEPVGNQNPWFQFMDQRGDIRMGAFFIDLMNTEGDPRLGVIADTIDDGAPGFTYAGSPAGTPDLFASNLKHLNNPTQTQNIMTYAEVKFIEAEAAFQTGDLQRAADAHNAAVLASLASYGVSDAAFEANHANQTMASISLGEIMTQKYVAMYGNPESFNDWRRTGIPALTIAANAQTSAIPTRWPYPQDERLYNTSFPGNASLTDKVWWDQ